jgi:hypothetical protein
VKYWIYEVDLLDRGRETIHLAAPVVGSGIGTWQAILSVEAMLHALVAEASIWFLLLVSPKSCKQTVFCLFGHH